MEHITLAENERIDDLMTHNLKIIQSDEVFSFSLDSVLLARFCNIPPKGKVLDLCSGNGVIPLLLSTRTKANLTAVEIQPRLAEMANRNVLINRLEHQIKVVQGDLREFHKEAGYGTFDAITVNPPYLPVPAGEQNINQHVAIARHEVLCTLEELFAACSRLVRTRGKIAMIHRPSRLVEIFCTMRLYRIEPKRLRFVHPRADAAANMVLIEGVRDGKPDVSLLPPLIVYESNGQYCKELLDIYTERGNISENGKYR